MAKREREIVGELVRRALNRVGPEGADLRERLAWLERRADQAIGALIDRALSPTSRTDAERASRTFDEADRALARLASLARSGARAVGLGGEEE